MKGKKKNNHNNGSNSKVKPLNVQIQKVEQPQPVYIWVQYPNKRGNLKWTMVPEFYSYFQGLLQCISTLRDTVNKKWRPDQLKAYTTYLNDLQSYIQNYIFTCQVIDHNIFLKAIEDYNTSTNPLGRELYDTQLDYLQKLQSGHDFRLDKKTKKAQKAQQNKQDTKIDKIISSQSNIKQNFIKPVSIIRMSETKQIKSQEKEEVSIRREDPVINIQALMATQWPKDQYTDLVEFKKPSINIVLIGGVDSGKSTLIESMMKNFKYSGGYIIKQWDIDSSQDNISFNPDQGNKVKTIQCSQLSFSLKNKRFIVFDAPGGKIDTKLITPQISKGDVAILVVSGKTGQFELQFEKEGHIKQQVILAKALGVSTILVAVTKMSSQKWSEQRFDSIKNKISPFLENYCGIKDVTFIPLCSKDDFNICNRIQGSWYKGLCLHEALQKIALPQRQPLGPLRIPIINSSIERDYFFCQGKIESGTIFVNQKITILPSKIQGVIVEILNNRLENLPFAMAGENVKLKITGINQNDIKGGDIICNNLNYCMNTYQFKATTNVIQNGKEIKQIAPGYKCQLHMLNVTQNVEIFKVQTKQDPQTKKNVTATSLKSGQTGSVSIKCSNILCLEKYSVMSSFGRFALTNEGKTVAEGFVTMIKPASKLSDEQKERITLQKNEK